MKVKYSGIILFVAGFAFSGCVGPVGGSLTSDSKEITYFGFASPPVSGAISQSQFTITVLFPSGTAVDSLVPTIVHTGESVSPGSGVAVNFIHPAVYTVIAADGSSQTYTVTVTVAGGGANTNTLSARAFWGGWKRISDGEILYIAANRARIGTEPWVFNASATETVIKLGDGSIIDKISDNILRLRGSSGSGTFFRDGGANASFSGTVKGFEGEEIPRSIGLGGLGGISLILQNIKNANDTQTVITSADGSFTGSNISLGDQYDITPEGGVPVTVSAQHDKENIGTIPLTTHAYAYKTCLTSRFDFLYADGSTKTINVRVTNSGTDTGQDITYSLTALNGLQLSSQTAWSIGSLEPGSYRDLTFSASCPAFEEEYQDKLIRVDIIDSDGNTWDDTVSLRYYREAIVLQFSVAKTNGALNCIVTTPDKRSFRYAVGSALSLPLPRVSEKYTLAVSGNGVKYSIGVGTGSYSAAELASDAAPDAHEPNDDESSASDLFLSTRDKAVAESGDLDIYELDLSHPETRPEFTTPWKSLPTSGINISVGAAAGSVIYGCGEFGGNFVAYDTVARKCSVQYALPARVDRPTTVASWNDRVFMVGYQKSYVNGQGGGSFGDVFEYDIANNSWIAREPCPLADIRSTTRVDSGIIAWGVSESFLYRPDEDAWEDAGIAAPSGPYAGIVSVGGRLMTVPSSNNQVYTDAGYPVKLRLYNAESNSWEDDSALPVLRDSPGFCVYGGSLYIMGGRNAGPSYENETDENLAYDPADKVWTTKSSLPGLIYQPFPVACGGLIFVFGRAKTGHDSSGGFPLYVPAVLSYDPAQE